MQTTKYYNNIKFWLLFIQNFLFFSSHAALNNFSPYLLSLGLTKTFTGFFMNLNAIGLIIFVILLGHYVENINKKILIITTYSIELISYIFMFFNSNNILLLVLFKILASLSFAVGFTVNASLAFNLLPIEKRTSGIAFFGISGIIANPISAFLGEQIIKKFSYSSLFLLGGIFSSFAIITTFFIQNDVKSNEKSNNHFLKVLKRKDLQLYFFYGFILGGVFSILVTFIPPLTVEKFQFSKLSIYFASYSITAILFRTISSKKIDFIGKKTLFFIAFLFLTISMLNTAFLFFVSQLVLTGIFYGIAHSILYPTLSAIVVKLSDKNEKYLVNSTFITCYIIGSITISTLIGRIGDIFNSISSIFITMSLISLICTIIPIFIKNKKGCL